MSVRPTWHLQQISLAAQCRKQNYKFVQKWHTHPVQERSCVRVTRTSLHPPGDHWQGRSRELHVTEKCHDTLQS